MLNAIKIEQNSGIIGRVLSSENVIIVDVLIRSSNILSFGVSGFG